jgi:hypothetical protein
MAANSLQLGNSQMHKLSLVQWSYIDIVQRDMDTMMQEGVRLLTWHLQMLLALRLP